VQGTCVCVCLSQNEPNANECMCVCDVYGDDDVCVYNAVGHRRSLIDFRKKKKECVARCVVSVGTHKQITRSVALVRGRDQPVVWDERFTLYVYICHEIGAPPHTHTHTHAYIHMHSHIHAQSCSYVSFLILLI